MRFLQVVSFVLVFLTFSAHTSSISESCGCDNGNLTAGNVKDLFIRQILDDSSEYGNLSQFAPSSTPLKVGIIGAGSAGLYAAILLQSLGIDYEILEANSRIGGRIYTHRFDEAQWNASRPGQPAYYNYYDAGAMRFPGLSWMDRVIGTQNNSIVSYINANVANTSDKVALIPYIFQANNTFRYFNNKLVYNQVNPSAETFGVLTSEGGTINDTSSFAAASPGNVFDNAIGALVSALSADFDAGFDMLMQYDQMSVREYLVQAGYTSPEIDWMETLVWGTSHFDTTSLSQIVLEQWIFDSGPLTAWQCVEGGMDRIINGMVKVLKTPVLTSKRVTGLQAGNNGSIIAIVNGTEERIYAHVINTVTLGSMQKMDMTTLNLDYRKKLAMRKLRYDTSGKVGMSFSTRWWESSFKGGQSTTDLPTRRCVYPSYGINTTGAAGAMIASYTWSQDSSRMGAYYHTPDARSYILGVILHDLALMNNVTEDFLQGQLIDTHFWDWYSDEYSDGGYAWFGPDDYTGVLPSLMKPAYNGRLHFAGEALSSGHGWIVGAANSAYRTVAEILAVEGRSDLLTQLVYIWGTIDEVDMGWYNATY